MIPTPMRPLKTLLLALVSMATALAATTRISTDKPIINFSTSTFTPEGHRSWLLRASQAQPGEKEIEVSELTLAIFPGKADNEKVETMILSPTATVLPADSVVTGRETIRVINDQFEAAGSDWRYEHREQEKKITINRNVRVTFRAELKEILQ